MTAAAEKLRAYYYRDFSAPIAILDQSASELVFDEEGEQIVAVEGKEMTVLRRVK
jgi:hypothetical protein